MKFLHKYIFSLFCPAGNVPLPSVILFSRECLGAPLTKKIVRRLMNQLAIISIMHFEYHILRDHHK